RGGTTPPHAMGRWRRRRRRGQSIRKTPPHVIEDVAGQLLPMKWGGGAEGAGGAKAVEKLLPMKWGGGGAAAGGAGAALDCRRFAEGKAARSNWISPGGCAAGCLRPDRPTARNPPDRRPHIPVALVPSA